MVSADKIATDFYSAFKDFLNVVTGDPRLGPLHISLYAAILHFYNAQEERVPISVFGKTLMTQAKIFSRDTYCRHIQELHTYGYIYYIPSYNPLLGSLIYPLKLKSDKI